MASDAIATASGPAGDLREPGWHPETVYLRNMILRAARNLDAVQDQIDCAELALRSGFPASARLLYSVIFLTAGFSTAQRRMQSAIARRTGMSGYDDGIAPSSVAADARRFSVDIAVADLTRLLSIAPQEAAGVSISAPPAGELTADALALACEQLAGLLRRPDDERAAELAAVLASLGGLTKRPPIALDERMGADLPDLVAHLASNMLRYFLGAIRVIAGPPFGSPALLRAAAQLDEEGFRPYFRNVSQLIRGPRDIFALIELAGAARDEQGGVDRDELERWTVLLSVHLDKGARLGLVDEIADIGLRTALAGQLEAVLHRRQLDQELLWRIRDGALDIGDFAIAARAQEAVRDLSPGNRIEWTILGEIEGSAGQTAAAEAALLGALRLDPANDGIQQRLLALAANRFGPFRVTGGYGTPHHRQLLRRRARPWSR